MRRHQRLTPPARARARPAPRRSQEFKSDLELLETAAVKLVRLFGEDPAETEPHQILGTLNMFLRRVEKATDDVRRRREAEGKLGKTPRRRRNGPSAHSGLTPPERGDGRQFSSAVVKHRDSFDSVAMAIGSIAIEPLERPGKR